MKRIALYCLSILTASLMVISCKLKPTMNISIDRKLPLTDIPSASGIENDGEFLWIIGDNSPYIFQLNKDYQIQNKYTISFGLKTEPLTSTISKEDKKDFEAMTMLDWEGESCIFLFGSGSKAPQRNEGLLLSHKGEVLESFDLTDFYGLIQDEAKLDDEDLNLEAATVLDDKLYLFNRGKNKLISMKTSHFVAYLEKKDKGIKMKSNTIDLPEIDGVKAGFSGATSDVENKRILFSASVENTSNWVDDGAVLGSFIGVIVPDEIQQHYTPLCTLIQENEPLLVKVESLTVITSSTKSTKVAAVTDSDGSESEVIELTIWD